MANEKRLYLVAQGDYSQSALAAESWQIGVHLWADLSIPEDQGTFPDTGTFEAASDSSSPSIGTIVSNWNWAHTPGNLMDPVDYLETIAGPAFATWWGATSALTSTRLQRLILYPREVGTTTWHGMKTSLEYASPPVGVLSAAPNPLEVATAVSFRTPRIGRHGKGRVFLPTTGTTQLDSNGNFSSSYCSNVQSAMITLLESIALENLDPTGLHIRPVVTGPPFTQYGVITSVGCGNVPDSQRRRRRQLVETRTFVDVSYG